MNVTLKKSMWAILIAMALFLFPISLFAQEGEGGIEKVEDATGAKDVKDVKDVKDAEKSSAKEEGEDEAIEGREKGREEGLRFGPRVISGDSDGIFDDLVPILVPTGCFLMIFGIVAVISLFRYRQRLLFQQVQLACIEKGIDPPVMEPEKRLPKSITDFRRGIILMAIGFGVGIFFLFQGDTEEIGIGMIPVCIGAGYLITGFFIAKKEQHRPLFEEKEKGKDALEIK